MGREFEYIDALGFGDSKRKGSIGRELFENPSLV